MRPATRIDLAAEVQQPMDGLAKTETTLEPELMTARTQIRDFPFKSYQVKSLLVKAAIHAHDYLQIWYIRSGGCVHQINDQGVTLRGGDIFIIPPFVPHGVSSLQDVPVEIIGCEFPTSLLNADLPERFTSSPLFDYGYLEPFLLPAREVNPGLHLDRANREIVEDLLLELLQDYSDKPPYHELSIKANVLRLLVRLARLLTADNPGHQDRTNQKNRDALAAVLAYLHQNYTQEIYIRDLCTIALMSRSSLSDAFRHLTGQTVVDYINYLRIHKAQSLLADLSLDMTDICFHAGFNDASYFARIFRKETGVSPRAYRRMIEKDR
jgi:AraC-like DNA-binding protein/mannose-6-phosphate isomerase-like protein (cupin superfamily)